MRGGHTAPPVKTGQMCNIGILPPLPAYIGWYSTRGKTVWLFERYLSRSVANLMNPTGKREILKDRAYSILSPASSILTPFHLTVTFCCTQVDITSTLRSGFLYCAQGVGISGLFPLAKLVYSLLYNKLSVNYRALHVDMHTR